MIVLEKLKNFDIFSPNEEIVAKYLLSYTENISKLSTIDISNATYTSPSTTIRLSKKLGYDGWLELRDAIHTEKKYLENINEDIDPSFPFHRNDSIQKIANKLSQLQKDTIQETLELLKHDDLLLATQIMNNAKKIYIFAMANTATTAFDFQYKMRFLFKPVEIINNRDDFSFVFQTLTQDDCCVFISYSGQTFEVLQLTSLIQNCICPTISITGYSDNHLTKITQSHLYIPLKENQYSKIGPFSSNESIHFILDLLYACVFNKNYEKSIEKRKSYIKTTDNQKNF